MATTVPGQVADVDASANLDRADDSAAAHAGGANGENLGAEGNSSQRRVPPPLDDDSPDQSNRRRASTGSIGGRSSLRQVRASLQESVVAKLDNRKPSKGFMIRKKHLVSQARSPSSARTLPVPERKLTGHSNLGEFVASIRKSTSKKFFPSEAARNLSDPAQQGTAMPAPAMPASGEDAPVDEAAGVPQMPALLDKPVDAADSLDVLRKASHEELAIVSLDDVERVARSWEQRPIWEQYDPVEELHIAVLRDDAERIRYLVAGPDENKRLQPDLTNADGDTPAIVAAKNNCIKACAALLDHGADAFARDLHPNIFGDGIWPNESHPDIYGRMVKDPDSLWDMEQTHMPSGRTVIFFLRLSGKLSEVLDQLFPNTRFNIVRRIDEAMRHLHSCSPLLLAARENYPELSELLTSCGSMGLTRYVPSVHARAAAQTATQTHLRSYVSGFSYENDSRAPSVPGYGHMESKVHWWQRTDFNERGPALLEACERRHWRVALALLKAGVPMLGANLKDKLGRSSLHLAALAGEAELVRLLLVAGADVALRSSLGRLPIHEACATGRTFAVQALLDGTADPGAIVEAPKLSGYAYAKSGDAGRNSYELAAARGHKNTCDYLALRGAAPGGVAAHLTLSLSESLGKPRVAHEAHEAWRALDASSS